MGISVMFSVSSALAASAVVVVRRKKAIKQGLGDNAHGIVNIGQIEFNFVVLPKSMGSLALALMLLATGVANIEATMIVKLVKLVTGSGGRVSWLPDNINHGHYDYYYCLLALLGVANFIYFVVCCYWFEETTPNQLVESSGD